MIRLLLLTGWLAYMGVWYVCPKSSNRQPHTFPSHESVSSSSNHWQANGHWRVSSNRRQTSTWYDPAGRPTFALRCSYDSNLFTNCVYPPPKTISALLITTYPIGGWSDFDPCSSVENGVSGIKQSLLDRCRGESMGRDTPIKNYPTVEIVLKKKNKRMDTYLCIFTDRT